MCVCLVCLCSVDVLFYVYIDIKYLYKINNINKVMPDKLIIEDRYTNEFGGKNIIIIFKHYIPDKYEYFYDSNIKRKVMMEVYFRRDDEQYDEKDRIGYHIANIDQDDNIHGDIAEVKSFLSKNKEEKDAMKGLGKFMLCTLTRYIVDMYDVDTNKLYYGEAVGGVPHFVNYLYKIYHPHMCEVSGSSFNEIIYPTVSKSGRVIPPLLSDEELKFVMQDMLLLPQIPIWNREEELGPNIDVFGMENKYDMYDMRYLRKIAEDILLSDSLTQFIKNCIMKIFPSTWKDIQKNLTKQDTLKQILSNMEEANIPQEYFEISYYGNIMCEILATHRLMNYYENEMGFMITNKTDGRKIEMEANIGVRLDKCKRNEKEFYRELDLYPKEEEEEEDKEEDNYEERLYSRYNDMEEDDEEEEEDEEEDEDEDDEEDDMEN